MHAFGGAYEQALRLFERGFLIGVGGGITRVRARRIRQTATRLPLDALLLETDAPAIGMDIVEPPDVRPAHLPRVAAALAELRGTSVEEIEARTDENALRMFGEAVSPASRARLRRELERARAPEAPQ
jgi:TatD DNase family protein